MENKFFSHEKYYAKHIRDPGIEGRKASRLQFLRAFNNWIKAVMIKNYGFKAGKNLAILDMCCGRGGDLEKFFRSNAKLYCGVDIEENLLVNAMDRIVKLKNEKMRGQLRCKCFLIKDDASDPNGMLPEKYPPGVNFDLVSCQFALHYHFESEERLRKFFENITVRLKEGGYFFGTIIDSNVLVKRLRNPKPKSKYEGEKFTFGNEFYAVKCTGDKFPKDKSFGINYGFYLEDSIDKRGDGGEISFVGEYLIVFSELVKIAADFGFELVEDSNFHDYYEEKINERLFADLFKRIVGNSNPANLEDQWEISHLYKMFCFRKGKENTDGKPANSIEKLTFKSYEPEMFSDKFD